MKFKVGDFVRVVKEENDPDLIGLTGEIQEVDESDHALPYEVFLDALYYNEWFSEDEIQLVEGETK